MYIKPEDIVYIQPMPLPTAIAFYGEFFECKGKKPYNSKNDAMKEIHRLMVESMSNTTFLRTYKCKYCKKYHLTSNQK